MNIDIDEFKTKIEQGFALYRLPEHMLDGVRAYILHGRPTGHFLEALFSNDFMGACARADGENLAAIVRYATFLFNIAPKDCYGSPERVAEWIRIGGYPGIIEAGE